MALEQIIGQQKVKEIVNPILSESQMKQKMKQKVKCRNKIVYSNDRKVVFEKGKTIYNTDKQKAQINKGVIDNNMVIDKYGRKMTFGEYKKRNK